MTVECKKVTLNEDLFLMRTFDPLVGRIDHHLDMMRHCPGSYVGYSLFDGEDPLGLIFGTVFDGALSVTSMYVGRKKSHDLLMYMLLKGELVERVQVKVCSLEGAKLFQKYAWTLTNPGEFVYQLKEGA